MKKPYTQEVPNAGRWACPSCGRENGPEMVCSGCGFDSSANYLAYPTLMPLPRREDPARSRMTELEAKVQRLLAEEQRQAAELTRMETAVQRLRTEQQACAEEIKRVQAELALLKAAQSARKPKQNRMRKVGSFRNERSLDGVTPKTRITEVRFLNTLVHAPEDAADLSEAGNGSVRCWTRGTVQYIAGEGGVVGGSSCAYLFTGYENVSAIQFAGNFDTSGVTDMSYLFFGCSALTALDLSGWDTSNVTNMIWMFAHCKSLRSLDLSGWNTSGVENMTYMFYRCVSLTDFDPSWLDTAHANTFKMYADTPWK